MNLIRPTLTRTGVFLLVFLVVLTTRVFLLVFLVVLTTSLFWNSFASKFAFLCDCNVVEWRSTTKSIIAAVRFFAVRRSASSGSADSVSFPVPAGSGSVERAIARERTRDSVSALEAEGRLIGGSGGVIAALGIAERAIARDLG